MRRFLFLLLGALLLGLRPMTIDDQFRLQEPSQSTLSPNGRWVFYTVRAPSLKENAVHERIWLAPTDGSVQPRAFLQEGDNNAMWSPNSESVYFLRTVTASDGRRRSQLFRQGVNDADARQLSHLPAGNAGSWQMCSAGSVFLIVRAEDTPDAPGVSSDVTIVNEGSNGQSRATWDNLWLYNSATDTLRRITNRKWAIVDASLSGDCNRAVVAARPDHDRNGRWKSELFVVELPSGAARQITHNRVPEASPQWSPDNRNVLFSAVSLRSWQNGNGDLWLLDSETGRVRDLTPNHRGRFGPAVFSADGKTIYAASGYGTTRFPVAIDVQAGGHIRALIRTSGNVRPESWSANRTAYSYVYQDSITPPDVYVGWISSTGDRQQRISDLNPWVRNEIALSAATTTEWQSRDGLRIEGLLYRPLSAPQRGSAAIVNVPCGPGCAWLNSFSIMNQVWAGLGYVQLFANVRGASNYDDRYMRANTFDIGGGDSDDIITGAQMLVERHLADPHRIALKGWSYGAVLGGMTISRTRVFSAASLGAMVSNWPAEFGNASYDVERWYIGGNPWSNAAKWQDRSSFARADRIHTPTLLHHGDDDTTDWPIQSMDFYAALRHFGTPVRLVRYPNEGHDFTQPQHLRLRDTLDVEWFARWLQTTP